VLTPGREGMAPAPGRAPRPELLLPLAAPDTSEVQDAGDRSPEGAPFPFTPVGGLCRSRPSLWAPTGPPLVEGGSRAASSCEEPGEPRRVPAARGGVSWSLLTARDLLLLAVYFVAQSSYALTASLVAPCLDEFATLLHRDTAALAASPSASATVGLLASFAAGTALDSLETCWDARCASCVSLRRRLGHMLLALAIVLQGGAGFFVPFTPPSFGRFVLALMLNAGFTGFVNIWSTTLTIRVSMNAEQGALTAAGHRSPAGALTGACISIVHTGVGAGAALAPLLANLSEALGRPRSDAFLVLGPSSLLLAGGVLALLPPCRASSSSPGAQDLAGNVAQDPLSGEPVPASSSEQLGESPQKVHTAEAATGAVGGAAASCEQRHRSSAEAAARLACEPHCNCLLVLLLASMLLTEGQVFGGAFYGPSALHALGFSEDAASFLVSASSAGFGLSRLLLSIMGPRLRPSLILAVMLPVGAVCLSGQWLLASTLTFGEPGLPVALMWVCYIGNAVGMSAAYAWLLALYASCQQVTGYTNGLCIVAVHVGVLVSVNVSGQTLKRFGAPAYYLACSGLAWLGVLCVQAFRVFCRRILARRIAVRGSTATAAA